MDILEGLSSKQIQMLRHCRSYREFKAGEVIFYEDQDADSLFIIVSGKVEIFKSTPKGDYRIAELKRPEVFGEMGFLIKKGRTAAARALEDTILFEVPLNIIDVISEFCAPEETLRLIQNLVSVLAERLRKQNELGPMPARQWDRLTPEDVQRDMAGAVEVMESAIPLLQQYSPKSKLAQGEYLFRQGEPSDGFYIIHKGRVEIVQKSGDQTRVLSRPAAPAIAGEVGFFSKEKRSASVRAVEPLEYTHFSGPQFEKLVKKKPRQALDMLFAAAQIIVCLVMRKNVSRAAG